MEIGGMSKDFNLTKEQKTAEIHTWIAIVFKHNGKLTSSSDRSLDI